MSDLPDGWEWATLGELCEARYGKALASEHREPEQDVPVVGSAGIMSNTRDPLISEPCIVVGRKGNAGAVQVIREASWPIDTVFYIPAPPGVDIDFLGYQISTAELGRLNSSTAMPSLRREDLNSLPVSLPPLAEQRRIVAALESHLSRVDAGMKLQEAAQLRAQSLVKRILVEGVPVSGPVHWRQTTVGEAGSVELGRQRHPDWHSGPNMRPYLRVANVFEDRIDTTDVMEMDFPQDKFDRFRLVEGDILLNEGQSPELLGRPAMYRGAPREVAFTNSLLRFRCGPDVDPEWALLVFRRHMHSRRYLRNMRITTNIAHLSAGRFKNVEFPVPPLSEQKQIVQRVHERLNGVERLATEVIHMDSRAEHLRRSLFREAFAGRLVEQDPADEPASVLLERIRAERESVPKAKRARKPRAKKTAPGDVVPAKEIAADRPLPESVGEGTQDTLDLGI